MSQAAAMNETTAHLLHLGIAAAVLGLLLTFALRGDAANQQVQTTRTEINDLEHALVKCLNFEPVLMIEVGPR